MHIKSFPVTGISSELHGANTFCKSACNYRQLDEKCSYPNFYTFQLWDSQQSLDW